jgi:hypothetical protein
VAEVKFRRSNHYLVRSGCAVLAMIALTAIVWDNKAFNGLGNVFMLMCVTYAASTAFHTWRTIRLFEKNLLK